MLLSESALAPAWVVVQVLLAVATAVPLLFWRRGDRFRGACLAGSGILFAAAVLGAVVYLIVYLPSAVLLLLAGLAHPQRRPRLTRVVLPVTLVAWLFVLLPGSATAAPPHAPAGFRIRSVGATSPPVSRSAAQVAGGGIETSPFRNRLESYKTCRRHSALGGLRRSAA